jgi:hypothetical protein
VPGPGAPEPIAPAAVRLVIAPGQASASVDVPCWRELWLAGNVVGPGGEPVLEPDVLVSASTDGFATAKSARDGAFRLGPVPPGRYRLTANAFGGTLGPSEPVMADAGALDLVLRLRPGASLHVRVVDAGGNPARGVMLWATHEAERGASGFQTDDAGVVERSGLLAGAYTLTVSGRDGEYAQREGVRLAPVASGSPGEPLELRLEPAARLRLRVPAAHGPQPSVTIRQAGRVVALALPDEDASVSVPPGELELELRCRRGGRSEVIAVRRVLARIGEETIVEFDAP